MFISYIINILKEEPIKSISLNRSKNKCQKTELIVRGLHEYTMYHSLRPSCSSQETLFIVI